MTFSISTSLEATPLLEQLRSSHEEIERLEQLVMKDLYAEPPSLEELLLQGHRLQSMTKLIILKTEKLVETYAAITDEIALLSDKTATWTNVSSDFFYRLEKIHEHHGKHPSERLLDNDDFYDAFLKQELGFAFSEEEGFGRYLDLHDMYNQYINSNFGERVEYSAYLDVFSQPEKIPRKLKLSRQYTEYIEALLAYLIYFFKRTRPLQDLERILSKVGTDFEEQYADGKVESGIAFEIDSVSSVQHARLEMQQSLMEAKVKKLCNLLDETIERTKQKGEKKRNWEYQEMKEEINRLRRAMGLDEKPIPYWPNRHGLAQRAMGWDGKPIAYWLNELGLAQEHKCEICSNRSYWGKRDFERHFEERHHQAGLHRLGITYTKENLFKGITLIEEAKEVWKRIPKMPVEDEEIIENQHIQFPRHPHYPPYPPKDSGYPRMYHFRHEEMASPLPPSPEIHRFTYELLGGITAKELDVIKLTAEFWARYGACFSDGFMETVVGVNHPEFEFMNKPNGGRFYVFSHLLSGYTRVLNWPPELLKEKLKDNAADVETVLENCYRRLQFEGYVTESIL